MVFKKFLLVASIVMIIGHIVLFFLKEESLTSFLLGVFAMICLIISVIVSKDKSQ